MRSAEAIKETRSQDWSLPERPGRDLEQLARRLEIRVPGMRGHSRRVAVYAALTAKRMGRDGHEVGRVRRAAAVHDIGKVEVPAEVLNRSGPVADEEFARIQHGAGLDLLEREAGGHLDPRVVAALRVHCSGLRGVPMAVRSS
jgi:HD-GYP domain-containing protein (c-di-GMP phosphodiesterase class II)